MCDPKDMKFEHSYMKQDKLDANRNAFNSKFDSFMSDGSQVFANDTIGGMTRDGVLRGVRANLRSQMIDANRLSEDAAKEMQRSHKALRVRMQESLLKAKTAMRQKRKEEARLLAAKSKQSGEKAEDAQEKLDAMLTVHDGKLRALMTEEEYHRNITLKNGVAATENEELRAADEDEIDQYRDEAIDNQRVHHHCNPMSLFRAISKKIDRNKIESEIEKQEEIIATETTNLKAKAKEWNDKRKRYYDSGSFRKFYDAYDRAASEYRALNRNNQDISTVASKNVREYVGEFDINSLKNVLSSLKDNPYLNVDVDIKNKKDNLGIGDADLIKSHTKMTLFSEADANGVRQRYKVSSDFTGYKSRRQLDANSPTGLTLYNATAPKVVQNADAMKLQVDEKAANGEFINSQHNIELIQAKQKKFFGAEIVNGVFLNGRFISVDRSLIDGNENAKFIGTSLEKLQKKELIRRAVLRSQIFRQINSRTIEHAFGYEAGKSTNADKINNDIFTELSEFIKAGEEDIGWDESLGEQQDALESVAGLFEAGEEVSGNAEEDFIKGHLKHTIFSKENDAAIRGGGNVLPDALEARWERMLVSNNPEEARKIPRAARIKVVYDVLRQERKNGAANVSNLRDENTRAGKLLKVIGDDQKALKDISLLLLSNDSNPEYWIIAKDICTKLLLTDFEKKVEGTFDSRYTRAVAKAGCETGQMMRVALIDELNADRSHWDFGNLFGALMPTRWKQFNEDIAGKRGIGARLQQNFFDGSMFKFFNDVFSSVVTGIDGLELAGDETVRVLKAVRQYSTAITSAVDLGIIAEAGAYAVGDLAFEDKTYEKEINGKKKTFHTSDDKRNTIALVFTMVSNLSKLYKAAKAWHKQKVKEGERRQKNEKDFDAKAYFNSIDSKYYKVLASVSSTACTMAASIAMYTGAKELKAVFDMVRTTLSAIDNTIGAIAAHKHVGIIKDAQNDFKTAITERTQNADNEAMAQVLESNSQLMYGLSCAKRKSRNERLSKIFGVVSNAGKTVLSVVKAFFPEHVKKTAFVILDAAWGTLCSGVQAVTEMVRERRAVKANVRKMLGKEIMNNYDQGILDQVLKREAGIVSADYLTDLAAIFMSIDTHVFMKEASTDTEKKIGARIARTLFNNDNFNEGNLKKVDISKLMGTMGVKGNFHKILKYSLA